jgi:hypothetical protein
MTCVWEVLVLFSVRTLTILTEVVLLFAQSLQADSNVVP